MILHFSHIGLTEGRTFMFPFGWLPARRRWRTVRRRCHPPETRTHAKAGLAHGATEKHSKGLLAPVAVPDPLCAPAEGRRGGARYAAARVLDSCQGVRIRGPADVTAMVNSKCAVSDPSCE